MPPAGARGAGLICLLRAALLPCLSGNPEVTGLASWCYLCSWSRPARPGRPARSIRSFLQFPGDWGDEKNFFRFYDLVRKNATPIVAASPQTEAAGAGTRLKRGTYAVGIGLNFAVQR